MEIIGDNPYLEPEEDMDQTRRRLPHWDQDGKYQFVTYHLADSIPQYRRDELNRKKENWLKLYPKPWDKKTAYEYHLLFAAKIDKWLDAGYGSCILRIPEIAHIVEENLYYFDGKRYNIEDYVIMPNHVHILIRLCSGVKLSEIMQSNKSYTAKAINKRFGLSGQLWHTESYDRMIRDRAHYNAILDYIAKNVKQGGILWKKR